MHSHTSRGAGEDGTISPQLKKIWAKVVEQRQVIVVYNNLLIIEKTQLRFDFKIFFSLVFSYNLAQKWRNQTQNGSEDFFF